MAKINYKKVKLKKYKQLSGVFEYKLLEKLRITPNSVLDSFENKEQRSGFSMLLGKKIA